MDRMESGSSFDFTNSMEQHGVWWEQGREQNSKAANFPNWNCLAFGTNQQGSGPQFFLTYHLFSTHHCVFVVMPNMLLLSSSSSSSSSTRLTTFARCWGTRSSPCSALLPLLPTGSLALSCQTQAVSLGTIFLNVLQPIDYLHKIVFFCFFYPL